MKFHRHVDGWFFAGGIGCLALRDWHEGDHLVAVIGVVISIAVYVWASWDVE